MKKIQNISAEEAMRELSKRGLNLGKAKTVSESIRAELFDKQLDFIDDPSRNKAAICTRRAGKTLMWARYCTIVAMESKCLIRIWGVSRLRAKQLLWVEFKDVAARHKIKIEAHETELTLRFDNGSEIRLLGADKDKEVQKKRGDKTKLEVILEAQSFGPYLRTMVEDVIEPCLFDMRGVLCMEGTPPPVNTGYWYWVIGGSTEKRWASEGMMVTVGDAKELIGAGWSCHRWSLLDNPMIDQWRGRSDWRIIAQKALEDIRIKRHWTLDNPTYVREYLGQCAKDDGVLFYKFNADRNTFSLTEIQPWGQGWSHVLGWDLGFRDDMALFVWGWHPQHRGMFEAFSWKKPGASAEEVVGQIDLLEKRGFNFIKKIADTGGGGRMFVEGVMSRHNHVFEAAKKTEKYDHVRLMNDDWLTGYLKVQEGSQYIEELSSLPKDPDWDEFSGRPPSEDPRFPNHLCDAALYPWRWAHAHLDYAPEKVKTEEEVIEDQLLERITNANRNEPWWETDGYNGLGADDDFS